MLDAFDISVAIQMKQKQKQAEEQRVADGCTDEAEAEASRGAEGG